MHKHGGDIYNHLNVIDFSANINFCGMPKAVADAAKEAVLMCTSYPDVDCTKLREAISQKEQIPMEWIICGNGAADLIFSLVLARRPREAVLMSPGFYEYEQALHLLDCHIFYYDLKKEDNFLPKEDYLSRITKETDLIFLCNPNNPTGQLMECSFLEQILKKCEQTETLLVIDECFTEFLEHPGEYSMMDEIKDHPNIFILKAFTKMYGMAGIRLGYGCSSNEFLLEMMKQTRQPWSVSTLAQYAGIAALKETAFVEFSKQQIKKEKEYLLQEFKKLGIQVLGCSANYLFFEEKEDFYQTCLEQGILIRDCSNYRGLRKGYYRIAVKSHEENQALIAAIHRSRNEVEKWQR